MATPKQKENEKIKANELAQEQIAEAIAIKKAKEARGERVPGLKAAQKTPQEKGGTSLEDQLSMIEEKLFLDCPDTIKDINGKEKDVPKVSWKSERKILKLFRKMLDKTPMPDGVAMSGLDDSGAPQIKGIANVVKYIIDLMSDSDEELTEIFSAITGIKIDVVDENYDFEVIMGTSLPFVLRLFGSALKAVLTSIRFKEGKNE